MADLTSQHKTSSRNITLNFLLSNYFFLYFSFICVHLGLWECQNFPGNKIPGQKISRRNVPGQENSGTRKFQEFHFSRNSRNIFLRKFQDFFLLEQKIPGLLTLLNSWTTNSVTEFSRTFFLHSCAFKGSIKHESPEHSQISWIFRAYEAHSSWISGAYEAQISFWIFIKKSPGFIAYETQIS